MKMKNSSLLDIVTHFLQAGKEGDSWDFKQEWHNDIADLLKDIICFANTTHYEDCFIIFGISNDLKPNQMTKPRRLQADILDALSKLYFAGGNVPKISVDMLEMDGIQIDVLCIYNSDNTPLYLTKPYGKMRAGCIYTRVGDKNTPDNGNAGIGEIESLWKKRFGLTKPPLSYIFDRLQNKNEWNESGEYFYNIYRPEFSLHKYYDEDDARSRDEFYSYAQTNEATSFLTLDIIANGTVLTSYQLVSLDSGRLCIPVPQWGFLNIGRQEDRAYKYYVTESDTYRLLRFMYDPSNMDERCAFDEHLRVVLLYHSEEERNYFENYISVFHDKLKALEESLDDYDYVVTETETKTKVYKCRLRRGVALNIMLEEWRKMGL